jgi:hypothetical protein
MTFNHIGLIPRSLLRKSRSTEKAFDAPLFMAGHVIYYERCDAACRPEGKSSGEKISISMDPGVHTDGDFVYYIK